MILHDYYDLNKKNFTTIYTVDIVYIYSIYTIYISRYARNGLMNQFLGGRLLSLQSMLELECPEYTGPRLTAQLEDTIRVLLFGFFTYKHGGWG